MQTLILCLLSAVLTPALGLPSAPAAAQAPTPAAAEPRPVAPGETQSSTGDDERPARRFPADTLAYVEARDLHQLLAVLSKHALLTPLEPAGGWLSEAENADELREALGLLEQRAGRPALSLVEDLAAGGAAFGFGLRRLKPAVTLVLEGASAERAETALQLIFDLGVELQPELRQVLDAEVRRDGVRVWRVDEAAIGLRGARLGLSTDERSLMVALGVEQEPERRQLAENEAFEAAFRTLDAQEAGVRAWVALEKLVLASQLGGDNDLAELAQLVSDPGAQGLLGPGISSVGRARSVAFALNPSGGALELRIAAESLDDVAASLRPGAGPAPRLDARAAGQAGHALVYRDYATLTDRRAELIAPDALPPFSAQLAELDVLFGGLRLAEDVLPDLDPWIEVVSRPIVADGHTRPGIELPAVAFLLEVHDAEQHGPVLESALQNLTALSNVERAQNGLSPLLMRLQREGERTWSTARWSDLPEGEVAGTEYNLAPAWALIGDRFVVATHESLLIDLFDELEAPAAPDAESAPAPIERLVLRGPVLAELARRQLGRLALASALSSGGDSAEAAARLEPLVEFAGGASLELEIEYRGAELRSRLALVPAAAGPGESGTER